MNRRIHAIAAFLLLILGAGVAGPSLLAAAEGETDEWEGLPVGQGREEVFALCGACHSLKLVTQQGLSLERWDEIIDWMVDEQAMDAPEPDERRLIVRYLARFYGPDRRARREAAGG